MGQYRIGAVVVVCAGALVAGATTLRLSARQGPVFRGGIDLVNVAVTVTDRRGTPAGDLAAADFDIYEDGRRQSIRYFLVGDVDGDDAAPKLHLGVLLDVSESMADDIGFARTASIKFLNTLPHAVDITLVDFDTEVRVARFSQADFPRLVERIRGRRVRGQTALYDAIGVYLDGAAEQDGRKIMLVYTDGGDTRSTLRLTELMDLLKASDVTVYAIGSLERQSSSVRTQQQMILRQIADVTGGQAYFPESEKALDKIYEQVRTRIRTQYTIGYLSDNSELDGAWRKVDIKITRRDARNLRIRARTGYFAPLKR